MAFQAKWLLGKTICNVESTRLPDINGSDRTHVERLRFTDGTSVRLLAEETEDEPIVTAIYETGNKRRRHDGKQSEEAEGHGRV